MAKIALVTGANRGIGKAIAAKLEARGCVVIRGLRSARGIDFGEVLIDLNEEEGIAAAASHVAKAHPHLDILINNAGILLDEDIPLAGLDRKTFRQTLEVNTLGAFSVTQAFLPLLRKAPDARVVNVSSGSGQLSGMGQYAPAYSVSKAALNALTIQQALAFKDDGITVNAICPGWVRTDMGGGNATRSPDEGADTAVWLALDESSGVTGKFWRDREIQDW